MDKIFEKVSEVKERIVKAIEGAKDLNALKLVQETELNKKSEFNGLMPHIRELLGEEKVKFGQAMNDARNAIQAALSKKEEELNNKLIEAKRFEWKDYHTTVSEWELKKFLSM